MGSRELVKIDNNSMWGSSYRDKFWNLTQDLDFLGQLPVGRWYLHKGI
jgi:hypothetical protein